MPETGVTGTEIADYVDRMIGALEMQPDLQHEARAAAIRIIVGAAVEATITSDRLAALHALDRAVITVAQIGAWCG